MLYNSKYINDLLATELFVDNLGIAYFEIKDSNLNVRYDAYLNRWLVGEYQDRVVLKTVSFEEVLDLVDCETQTQLLFHLDLFR